MIIKFHVGLWQYFIRTTPQKMFIRLSLIFVILEISVFLTQIKSQEVPEIIEYASHQYGAAPQNWDIQKDCDGYTYVANSSGILIYNGFLWQKLQLPENARPRTLYLGKDCKVYVGGYEMFGYIDNNKRDQPAFVSVSGQLKGSREEIWEIFGNKDKLYMQSFALVWTYDYKSIKKFQPPTNIMLGNYCRNKVIFPKINGGIYEFENNTFIDINLGENFPGEAKIIGLANMGNGRTLIATEFHGLFIYDGKVCESLKLPSNDVVKKQQLNKMIVLKNGGFAIGTILNGLYIFDPTLNIKYHYNKSSGLSNNTVLSLFETKEGNIWVGLDKNINVVFLSSSTTYYYDNKGVLGTVFTTEQYRGQTYLGTNQGIYIKKNKDFEIIQGSNGQVWDFETFDGRLFCGHNNGMFVINDHTLTPVKNISGTSCLEVVSEETMIGSTYAGLFRFSAENNSIVSKALTGGNYLIDKFIIKGNVLYGFHYHSGFFCLRLSEDYSKVEARIQHIKDIGGKQISDVEMVLFQDEVFALIDDRLYKIMPDKVQELSSEKIEFLLEQDAFVLIRTKRQFRSEQKLFQHMCLYKDDINTSVLVAFPEGYALYSALPDQIFEEKAIEIDYILVNGKLSGEDDLISLKHTQNNIQLYFKKRNDHQISGQYRYYLSGWDNKEHIFPESGNIPFVNLRDGTYTFLIKKDDDPVITKVWNLRPPWYKSWIGFLLYSGLIFFLLYFYEIWRKRKIQKHLDDERLFKQRELEENMLKAKAEQLERDVLFKSKLLVNRTLTIIQKNKMLLELKELIKKTKGEVSPQKVIHLIEKNMSSDEDWEIFEKNFAEVHQDFLKSLQEKFPDITASELRLAAYIRMNLSSKEIAPLMHISVRSIENKRYRLRKKLGISEDVGLIEFMMRM
ncbi:MAG: hypothetical protein IPN79_07130 [Saprospiraceae bacterium]|nr:hypothetical protein [Saprospiraceae bacterium]